jgi:hypothetical protein
MVAQACDPRWWKIMPPFYKSEAILSSGLTSWKMEPFQITALPFCKTSHAPGQAPPKLHPNQGPLHMCQPLTLPLL